MSKGKGNVVSSSGNGGILGSGIFGMFGTTIHCDSKDDSLYCSIMKFFNLFIILLIVGFVFYFAYTFFFSRKGKSYRS